MTHDQSRMLADMLDAAENAAPMDAVEAVTTELAAALGARTVSFLIADLSGRALVRLAHLPFDGHGRRDGDEVATVMPFDGGPAEQALRTQTVQSLPRSGGWTVLAPVTDRGEVIGLLEMTLPTEPGPAVLREISRTAHALAFVVIANRRHTDLFEWGQRTTPFSLSAEIQRRLLPAAFTCEGNAFTLSGWLEPAATIGGDTFDYSLGRDVLHFSVTDAMGHGVDSALTATLGVGSLRNSRRQQADLVEQAETANAALFDNAVVPGAFVTALLGRLDLRTAQCSLLNAGHVPPLLVRDGDPRELRPPETLPPLGMFRRTRYRTTEIKLQPGDRLVVLTDGMREREAAKLDLTARLRELSALHPREAVRSLADAVLEVAPTLADDATLLILDWHNGHSTRRNTSAGADQARTSAALPN